MHRGATQEDPTSVSGKLDDKATRMSKSFSIMHRYSQTLHLALALTLCFVQFSNFKSAQSALNLARNTVNTSDSEAPLVERDRRAAMPNEMRNAPTVNTPESGKPIEHKPVSPKIQQNDLRNLPTVEPWKPGDPVRVMPDLKKSDPDRSK